MKYEMKEELQNFTCVGSEDLTVVAMKNMIIKVVTPCDLAEARQHF
jgi:hypothetical protein